MAINITFKYAPWYDSIGCSCCEPTEMDSYILKLDDVLQTTEDGTPLQFRDEGEIAIYVLQKLGMNPMQVDNWEDEP